MLSVKRNGNDIELNGETDDEDMDGEMGFDDGGARVTFVTQANRLPTNTKIT